MDLIGLQHSSTSTRPGLEASPLRRVYGIRLLYRARTRRLIAFTLAGITAIGYIVMGSVQLATLPRTDLKWDWVQFRAAAVALNHGLNPYASFLKLCPGTQWCQGGYIFPPLLAEVLRPLASLSTTAGAAVWLLASHAMFIAAVIVTWRAVRDLVSPAAQAALLALTLGFLPLYVSLSFLQVGTLLLLLLALAASAQMRRPAAEARAGAWVGVAAVLRVSPVLLAPALAWTTRREGRPRWHWRGLATMLVTGVAVLGGLALLTGFTWTYFTDVLPRIGGGTPNLDNQSLPAVVERAYALWAPGVSPPATLIGAVAAVLTLVPTWLLWQRALATRGDTPAVRALGFAAMLAALPIASNITWQHHLILEVLVFALLAANLAVCARPGRLAPGHGAATWLAVAAYPLMWSDRHITDAIVLFLHLDNPTGWRVAPFLLLTAWNLAGMVCLWAACLVVMRQSGQGRDAVDGDAVPVVDRLE